MNSMTSERAVFRFSPSAKKYRQAETRPSLQDEHWAASLSRPHVVVLEQSRTLRTSYSGRRDWPGAQSVGYASVESWRGESAGWLRDIALQGVPHPEKVGPWTN